MLELLKKIFSKKEKPANNNLVEKIESNADNSNKELRIYDASMVYGGLQWYKSQYAKIIKICLVLACFSLISLIGNAVLLLKYPSPIYYASSPDGKITPLIPLKNPLLSQAGLLNWVSDTIVSTLALDFLHWKDKLTAERENFRPDAFKTFLGSLKSSGIIDMIESKRLNVSAVVRAAPVISSSGIVEGRMTWKIEVPITLSYESSKGVESTQFLIANVIVCRENTATTPRGVAIKQIIIARDVK